MSIRGNNKLKRSSYQINNEKQYSSMYNKPTTVRQCTTVHYIQLKYISIETRAKCKKNLINSLYNYFIKPIK